MRCKVTHAEMNKSNANLCSFVVTVLCAASLAVSLAGCGIRGSNVAGKSPVPARSAQATSAVTRSAPSNSDDLARLQPISSPASDPDRGNWETEAFGEAAQRQLDVLAKKLAAEAPITAANLSGLLTTDFRCMMGGTQLQVVFQDDALVVERPIAIRRIETRTTRCRRTGPGPFATSYRSQRFQECTL